MYVLEVSKRSLWKIFRTQWPLSIIMVPLQSFEMARFHPQSIRTLYVVLIIYLSLTLYIIRICLSLIEISNSL